MKQVIGSILGGGLGVASYYAYNAGAFYKPVIEEKKLNQKKIIYFEYEGTYSDFSPPFMKLIKESQQYLKVKNIFRIVYDNPEQVKDQNKLRQVIGLELENINDENGAKLLIKDKKDYQVATLEETQSINTSIQMKQKNFKVVFLLMKFKIYPYIQEYITQKSLQDKNFKLDDRNRIVEIYKFDESKNPVEIEFNVPYGTDSKSYNLHSKLAPQSQNIAPQPQNNAPLPQNASK